MTTKFNAEFIDVEAIESRVVTPDGRVTGLSRFKTREVKIVVLEEPPYCATVTYGAGIEGGVPLPSRQTDHEIGTFVGANEEMETRSVSDEPNTSGTVTT